MLTSGRRMVAAALWALASGAAAGALGWWRRALRVEVVGTSMVPSLEPGDRLVVVPAWRVTEGDLVAVADPRVPERTLVKRVARVDRRSVVLRGDNPAASTDSRTFGPVPRRSLRGRAVYCYAPAQRVGWLRPH